MDINKMKALPYDELRVLYRNFLHSQNISKATINTASVDTFYLWRKGSKDLFWNAVNATDFETEAKKALIKALSEYSTGNVNSLVSGYLSHLRRFRLFLASDVKSDPFLIKQGEIEKSEQKYLPITEENIEEQHKFVEASSNYGKEGLIIHDVLNAFPLHNDLNTIAMKIAVIDVTNSTHLSQYKSKLSLYDLAKVILEIPNFDERLAKGDPELVNIIARNIGAVNMFSFASKYCTYHNVEVYRRDDYSIFDGIVKNTLPYYIPGLTVNKIDKWRVNLDYKSFNECVGNLLDEHNIHIPFRRRKFDHFLWYANR
ncbi:hypothetical protein [Schinkia azotoformans]|uniref:hypothetical protein n=1 Tax=Schinkia azotoformans TaxID=1454 RepID=UPI002DBEE908|nr:hypothetical protein [Schinkia azotoformans]MEC1722205.1 PD-(D/E)XK nuclease family protein [Schinkia azotoformans]MED4412433.1 PD-(D/E)XK nuclease family protein [Schinkia azotoformans]